MNTDSSMNLYLSFNFFSFSYIKDYSDVRLRLKKRPRKLMKDYFTAIHGNSERRRKEGREVKRLETTQKTHN